MAPLEYLSSCTSVVSETRRTGLPNGTTRYVRVATSVIRAGQLTLEIDGKVQTFPLIKASKGGKDIAAVKLGGPLGHSRRSAKQTPDS